MSKRYENVIEKNKKKIKKIKVPKTPNDFIGNFLVDGKEALKKIKELRDRISKIEWDIYQMEDSVLQISKLISVLNLQDTDILKKLRDKA